MGRPAADVTNQIFGDLTALYRSSPYKETPVKWMCVCSCGIYKEVVVGRLLNGELTHCGCKTAEIHRVLHTTNEIGNSYEYLTVISREPTKDTRAMWLCRCKCGNTLITSGANLRRRIIVACPDCRNEARSESHIKDETGKHYGNFLVLGRGTKKSKKGEVYWLCRCKCNKEYEVRGSHLRSGSIVQCKACNGLAQRVENPVSGYPAEFSLRLRTKIRKRDKYICQYCKIQFGIGELDIHHIDHIRENNDPSNLVSLCNSCHYKMHRKDSNGWISYWQNYMKERFPND